MASKRTAPAEPEGPCHCTSLRKASRQLSLLYDTALAPSGLKTTQRAILAELRRSGPASVGGLAEALVMEAGGLAHTLKPLQRDELVTVEVDPDDRRGRIVRITPAGRRRLERSDALWSAAQQIVEASIDTRALGSLGDSLRLLASHGFEKAFSTGLGLERPARSKTRR